MSAIKVTVNAENPVQELDDGVWHLEHCGDYVCLANEGADVEMMLTAEQAQIILDSLQAALTPKESDVENIRKNRIIKETEAGK